MLRISGRIAIPFREIDIKAVRSQGSGGQNVNKVSTAIHLFFRIGASSLPDRVKLRLLEIGDNRISSEGVVVIKAQEARTQEANREAALARLKELIAGACVVPKTRRPTRPSKGAKEHRLKSKTLRGRTKSLRGRPSRSDG